MFQVGDLVIGKDRSYERSLYRVSDVGGKSIAIVFVAFRTEDNLVKAKPSDAPEKPVWVAGNKYERASSEDIKRILGDRDLFTLVSKLSEEK